jgi:ADP-ribose pyrophosphatase
VELVEIELSSEVVFRGGFLSVVRDQVRLPDGTVTSREFIPHPGASMIIPVTAEGKLVFIRQYRYAAKAEFIEFPAGKIDAGEDPLTTAKRELLEETGFVAGSYRHLTTVHPVIGYSNEKIAIYLATQLTPGVQKLDHGEFVEVFEMELQEAMVLMKNGEITDVKTMIGLFWYQQSLSAKW